MKCRHTFAEGVGKVLIPECWPVVHSGDIEDCICTSPQPTTPAQFERQRYKDTVNELTESIKRLTAANTALIQDNEELCRLLEKLTEKRVGDENSL